MKKNRNKNLLNSISSNHLWGFFRILKYSNFAPIYSVLPILSKKFDILCQIYSETHQQTKNADVDWNTINMPKSIGKTKKHADNVNSASVYCCSKSTKNSFTSILVAMAIWSYSFNRFEMQHFLRIWNRVSCF